MIIAGMMAIVAATVANTPSAPKVVSVSGVLRLHGEYRIDLDEKSKIVLGQKCVNVAFSKAIERESLNNFLGKSVNIEADVSHWDYYLLNAVSINGYFIKNFCDGKVILTVTSIHYK